MKKKKVIMTRLHATILIFLLLVALFIVGRKVFLDLYQKAFFQQETSQVPDLYVEMFLDYNPTNIPKQVIKAKMLHSDWMYNGENKVDGTHLDNLENVEFTTDETMYVIEEYGSDTSERFGHIWPSYYLTTNPSYLLKGSISAFLENDFYNAHANDPRIFSKGYSNDDIYTEKGEVHLSGQNIIKVENWLLNINYAKQGYGQYGLRLVYFGCNPEIVKDYIGCNTTDSSKLKEIANKLMYSEFFKDASIDGTTLNLKYDYYFSDLTEGSVNTNNLLWFACLNNIDKIVYTAENKKTTVTDNKENISAHRTFYQEVESRTYTKEEFENIYHITSDDIKAYIERSGK